MPLRHDADIVAECIIRMFDVMTFLFIFPFISAYIEHTGVPVPEVGFWSGFIESAMSPVQALILPVWGRYSDAVSDSKDSR